MKAIDAYLTQITPVIREQFAGIKITGHPVVSDIEFNCWSIGGKPTNVEHSSIGNNLDWDKIVTDKISNCKLPTFEIKNVSQIKVYARISYSAQSTQPQPAVNCKSYEEIRQAPMYRYGEMIFYGGTYVVAVPCIVMAVLMTVVVIFDLFVNKRTRVPSKSP